jgi:hypothetical protein
MPRPRYGFCFDTWVDGDWKPVPGYLEFGYSLYFASVRGEVCRFNYCWESGSRGIPVLHAPTYYRPSRSRSGYYNLKLGGRTMAVHVAVALAWYGSRPRGFVIRHLDGDPSNNKPDNLRYGTRSENMRDRWFHQRQREAIAAGRSIEGIVWRRRCIGLMQTTSCAC